MPRLAGPQRVGRERRDARPRGAAAIEPRQRFSLARQDHAEHDVLVLRDGAQDVLGRLRVAERQRRRAVPADDVRQHADLAHEPLAGRREVVGERHRAREDQRRDGRDDADPRQLAREREMGELGFDAAVPLATLRRHDLQPAEHRGDAIGAGPQDPALHARPLLRRQDSFIQHGCSSAR